MSVYSVNGTKTPSRSLKPKSRRCARPWGLTSPSRSTWKKRPNATEQDLEIQQNLVIVDTRARNYLNQLNDEVQDACAIFANRAAGQIEFARR